MAGVDRLVEVTARWYLQHVPGQLGRAIEAHAGRSEAFAGPSASPRAGPMAAGARTRGVGADGPWRARGHRACPRPAAVPRPRSERGGRGPGHRPLVRGRDARSSSSASPSTSTGSRLVSTVSTTTRWHRWALQALEEDLRLPAGRWPRGPRSGWRTASRRGRVRRVPRTAGGVDDPARPVHARDRARGGQRPRRPHGRGAAGPAPLGLSVLPGACSVGSARYPRLVEPNRVTSRPSSTNAAARSWTSSARGGWKGARRSA